MIKEHFFFGIQKYVKFAFITEKGVFLFFCCPVKLFTKLLINPTFSTSTSFMMAHFKAKNHEKTIQSLKSNVVKGQMSVMLWQTEVMGKGVTQKSLFIGDFLEKIFFLGCFVQFWTHSVIHGWKAWKQENFMVQSEKFLGLPFGVQNFVNTLAAESPL